LRGLCQAKAVASENFLGDWMTPSMKVPDFFQYPRKPHATVLVQHAMNMFYGWGITRKVVSFLMFMKVLMLGVSKKQKQKRE